MSLNLFVWYFTDLGFVSGSMRFRFHATTAVPEESQPMDIDSDEEASARSGIGADASVGPAAGIAGATDASSWVNAFEASPTAGSSAGSRSSGGISEGPGSAGGSGCCLIGSQWVGTSAACIEVEVSYLFSCRQRHICLHVLLTK